MRQNPGIFQYILHWYHLSTIHELAIRAQQLASLAQLVRALHGNRRTAGSIPARGPITPILAFFPTAPGYVQ